VSYQEFLSYSRLEIFAQQLYLCVIFHSDNMVALVGSTSYNTICLEKYNFLEGF